MLPVLVALGAARADAQIRVNPTGVNVNAQAATTVFLTFGGLRDQVPAEAFWCGELISATPDIGTRCDPATLFGRLPVRFDLSRTSGTGFTDIMSIPPSVARRAYQAAATGAPATFFYVRRFVSTRGGPDEYVAVICRLTSGGARVPLALTDVTLSFDVETPVIYLQANETVPPIAATIRYNGTGRLVGRWEVVLPGEELPSQRDLLTEATLPLEERGTQRRYAEIERFNLFLPPTGRLKLPGPQPSRLPTSVEGTYLLLFRVEASDDREADSDLGLAGAGTGVVHSGAIAGFAMPTLRYVVGSGGSELSASRDANSVRLLQPAEADSMTNGRAVEFSWTEIHGAAAYRLEVETPDGRTIIAALVPPGLGVYRAPPWLAERAGSDRLRWRVNAIDVTGSVVKRSAWRQLAVSRGTNQ